MENKKIIAAFVQLWMKYQTGEREILIDLACRELGVSREELFKALTEVSL